MKKRYIVAFIVIVLLAFTSPLFYLWISDFAYTMQEKKYYSEIDNFITDEAVVTNIIYNEKNNSVILWLSDIDKAYQDSTFKVNSANTDILFENGFFDNVKKGDKITYISAPGYFGDGYIMPIVALNKDNESFLTFSAGYENLMSQYN